MSSTIQIPLIPPQFDNSSEWSKYIRDLLDIPANNHRKQQSFDLYKYLNVDYHGELIDAFSKRFGSTLANLFRPQLLVPYTKQIIEAKAISFSQKVHRDIVDISDSQKDILFKLLFDSIDNLMGDADKALILDNTILLQVYWDEINQKMKRRYYPQYSIDLIHRFSDNGVKKLVGVIVSDFGVSPESRNFYVYTEQNYYVFQGRMAKFVQQKQHATGILPFVVVNTHNAEFADYLAPSIYRAKNDLELNMLLAGGMLMNKNQSHSSLVIHSPADIHGSLGDDDFSDGIQRSMSRSLRLDDPSFAIELPKDIDGNKTEVEYIQPDADFDGFISSFELFAEKWAQSEALPHDFFRAEGPEKTATSARLVDKRMSKNLKHMQNVWIDAEKQLYDISIALLRVNSPSIPAGLVNAEFTMEFFSEYNLLDNASVEDLLKLEERDVIDKVEVLARASGLTIQEAEKKHIESMERKNRLDKQLNQEGLDDTEQSGFEGERGGADPGDDTGNTED